MAKKKKVKQPKISESEMAANYGWALATLNSDPELKGLFAKAVKNQYSPERFTGELRNLNWYKNQSETMRRYTVLRTSEPGQYVTQVSQVMASLADQYSELTGEVLPSMPPSLQNGTVVDGSGFLWSVADQALRLGWNEAQIRDQFASGINWRDRVQKHTLSGSALGQLDSWRSAAASYGVKPTDDWFADQLKAVNGGSNTNEGVIGLLKQQSKQRYTAFAEQIDAGMSIQDLAENYRQSYGNVLEVPPNQVDVFDNHIQKALTSTDADGKPSPMTVSDFEKTLRQDDRWQYTKNANDSLMAAGHSIVRSFGLAAM